MRPEVIAEYIKHRYSRAIEVCIGNYWEVARLLGSKLIAAVDTRICNNGKIPFYVDDITEPSLGIYLQADLIYAIRPPPELWTDILHLAEKINADCLIRPMGNEFLILPFKLVNYRGEWFYVKQARSGQL